MIEQMQVYRAQQREYTEDENRHNAAKFMSRDGSMKQKTAFTLVELLIVIAIIGILISMLLPAVNGVREAGRRMTCANNLKQLGLAMHAYHEAHGHLPYSVAYDSNGAYPDYKRGQTAKGFTIDLLPHLEQQALRDAFEPGLDGNYSAGEGLMKAEVRDAMKTPIAVLQCPSDGYGPKIRTDQWQWIDIEVFVTNYKGVMGDNRMGGAASVHQGSDPDCHRTPHCNGLFWRFDYLVTPSFAHILDGQSNTFMLGETRPKYFPCSAAYFSNGTHASAYAPINYEPEPFLASDWWNWWGFSSEHPGGAHFVMADGSVHFVGETIDYTLYGQLSTRAGGEAVQLPD